MSHVEILCPECKRVRKIKIFYGPGVREKICASCAARNRCDSVNKRSVELSDLIKRYSRLYPILNNCINLKQVSATELINLNFELKKLEADIELLANNFTIELIKLKDSKLKDSKYKNAS